MNIIINTLPQIVLYFSFLPSSQAQDTNKYPVISNQIDSSFQIGCCYIFKDRVSEEFVDGEMPFGLPDGCYVLLYSGTDTIVAGSYSYSNNVLNGTTVWYYTNGKIRAIGEFRNDEIYGTGYNFYPDGKIAMTISVDVQGKVTTKFDEKGNKEWEIITNPVGNIISHREWKKKK